MSVPAIISDLSEVSEALRPYYIKDGEQFVVNVDDPDALPAIVEMKAEFEAAKASRVRLKDVHAKLVPGLKRIEDAFKARVNAAYREAHTERRQAIAALFKEHSVNPDELA